VHAVGIDGVDGDARARLVVEPIDRIDHAGALIDRLVKSVP
jgi:hypothetical protein